MNHFFKLLIGTAALVSTNVSAQNSFKPTNTHPILEFPINKNQDIRKYHEFQHDQIRINNLLKSLSLHYNEDDHNFSIQLPISDAQQVTFNLTNSQTLSTEFQSKYKGVYNLKGYSADKKYSIRITISDVLIFAAITNNSSNEKWIIQPATLTNNDNYIVFNTKDDMRINVGGCESGQSNTIIPPNTNTVETDTEMGTGQITTLKIAVVSTTQFTNLCNGSNQALVIVANTIDRVSEIYERDLNTKIQLTYLDILTDSTNIFYNNNVAPQGHFFYLNKSSEFFNNLNLNNVVDLGHVFSNLGGGMAAKPSLCSLYKYSASSGTRILPSEYFINTVAHEIGHQLNAGHTMSANTGSCGGDNYMKDDAWEIGGGSTIMSYTSSCAPLHYVYEPYHYFHAGSIQNMKNYINSWSCANGNYKIVTPRTNSGSNFSAPIITNNNNTYTIPPHTPFKLKINATDPNRDDLTYTFDQMDTLTLGMNQYPSGLETSGPLFRHLPPSTSPERYFPSLSNLANGNQNSYEVIPKVARTINFMGLVRDNHDENGRSATTNFTIQVANTQDSFAFTNLNNSTSFIANGTNKMVLEWHTASNIIPGNVNIRFSTDNGLTYPHLLVANTANDGHEEIIVPNFDICNYNGRFMIEAVDHIAFNINRAGIKISSNNNMAYMGNILPETGVQKELNHPDLNITTQFPTATAIQFPITKQLSNQVGNLYSSINTTTNQCITYTNSHYYDTLVIYPSSSGTYTFNLSNNVPRSLGMEIHKEHISYNITNNSIPYCESIIYNSKTNTNNHVMTMHDINNVAIDLCKGERYIVLIHNFSTSSSNTLSNYSLNITGGTIHSDGVGAPTSYHNGFVIYDVNSGIITKIKDNTDLSNSSVFPPSTYMIKGINANQNMSVLDNSYQGRPYTNLYNAIFQQTNNLDASVSLNQRIVEITAPLPIRLISWNGIINEENQSVLSWSAKEDKQFDYYILESSEDGVEFTPLAHINKQPISSNISTYQFIDEHFKHYNANTIFYRLSINNKDGKNEYTKVIALHKSTLAVSSIYPNPVIRGNNLQVSVAANKDYQITITNTVGQMIQQQSIKSDQNNLQISTKDLNEGIYFISIQNDNKNEIHKFVVTQ